jgi:acyl transferase domain-containing protein
LPNRISYFFDFRGPSIQIDTACSSSLVAIHEALQSLRAGNCTQALVAGINVMCDPSTTIAYYRAGMLSRDGCCKTFDASANGYVRGEGAVMLMLKPLEFALRARDNIYAVLKGSATNHGGQAGGLTVPNAQAQADLVIDACKDACVEIRSIGYIEAHGTATSLGDPIEVQGLKMAFSRQSLEQQPPMNRCGLGSVKTNLGHLEAAAGIVGLLKLVLSLQNRIIPASLNFHDLNPQIEFTDSPFYVTNVALPWSASQGTLLRGGVSSFGSGGANAHVIVEQYCEVARVDRSPLVQPSLVVLSAKNEERLRGVVSQLLEYLITHSLKDVDLVDIAYTLQVGRQAMEHRLAFTADTIKGLQAKLSSYLAGKSERGEIDECYRGEVTKDKGSLALFNREEGLPQATIGWLEQGKCSPLLEQWSKGLSVDWAKLYAAESVYAELQPKRLCLPTYPFAREPHWVGSSQVGAALGVHSVLHPLLHLNTSDLDEQRFSSTFSGEEFYLTDHVVRGSKVLPEAAYLEMARAAVERCATLGQSTDAEVTLKNIKWLRPLVVDEVKEVHISLSRNDNDEIEFEIYSAVPAWRNEIQEVVHAQGRAVLTVGSGDALAPIDLSVLRGQCDHLIDVSQCYRQLSAAGIEYRSTHRGLTSVQVGKDEAGQQFVLARVTLPACVKETQDQYVLHPSVLDCALQASIGLVLGAPEKDLSATTVKPVLPFALESLRIIDRSPDVAMVVIRSSMGRGRTDSEASTRKLDIEICDEGGRVTARLQGLSAQVRDDEHEPLGMLPSGVERLEKQTLLLLPSWEAKPLTGAAGVGIEHGEHWLCIDSKHQEHIVDLARQCPWLKWILLTEAGSSVSPAERVSLAGQHLFTQVQAILHSKPKRRVLLQVVIDADDKHFGVAAALSGLLKSAQQEHPKFRGQVIGLSGEISAAKLLRVVEENASERAKSDSMIRYLGDARQVASLKERVATNEAMSEAPWRDGGVYLITGGTGGLGLIVAREIVQKIKDARIILAGRSALSEEKQARLNLLVENGERARIEYRILDVTDYAAVQTCVAAILAEHGCLNGIVHSAGVIQDNFIYKKTAVEFSRVIAPKVSGTINLDNATQDVSLDLFILFSSISGIFGNVGQSDYAMANGFMDGYAGYRHQLVKMSQRSGRTLSINWPLWAEGGMSVDTVTLEQMHRSGIELLTTGEGIRALYSAWSVDAPQVVVFAGKRTSLVSMPEIQSASIADTTSDLNYPMTLDLRILKDCTLQRLKLLLSRATNLGVERFEVEEPLESYGIDSIMISQLNQMLGEVIDGLSKTLFYEYPTLGSLTEYLVSEYPELCTRWSELQRKTSTPAAKLVAASVGTGRKSDKRRTRRVESVAEGMPTVSREGIAIIGLSGRYPQANNIQEYWENLKDGKDCISEIPSERWSLIDFYEPDVEKAVEEGKSYSKWGGFIERFKNFDSLFFNISPREAATIDPQDLEFMETVWSLLECNGYTRKLLEFQSDGKTGVYVGATASSGNFRESEGLNQSHSALQSHSSIANRTSHFFGLRGPSVAVDTMCSSSLMAIHMACNGLLQGECEIAIAGGVNLWLQPAKYVGLGQARLLGRDSNSRSFSGGDGYLPAEAVGAVLLKRLSKAIADRDDILAVIKASAANHSGQSNGYMVPNPNTQAELIAATIKKAMIEPNTISYVEAAASGSSMGDAIEIRALEKVFGASAEPVRCAIGSVKSNIGHAEAASGISQLSKVVLQLQHRQLVATRKPETINPNLNLEKTPFQLQCVLQDWGRLELERDGQRIEIPRRALINSLGAGGTGVSVIVEEHIAAETILEHADYPAPDLEEIVVLSAKDKERLQIMIARLLDHIEKNEEIELADLAYTLQVGREAMDSRLALVVGCKLELQRALKGYLSGKTDVTAGHKEIVIYCGERDEQRYWRQLLSGGIGDAVITDLLVKRNLEKIALLWSQGGAVPWEQLLHKKCVRRIALPTYPFQRERLRDGVKNRSRVAVPWRANRVTESCESTPQMPLSDAPREYIVQFLARELGIASEQLNEHRELREYGVDSLIGRRLLRGLAELYSINVTGRQLQQNSTIAALHALVAQCQERVGSDGAHNQDVDLKTDVSAARAMPLQSQLMKCFLEGIVDYQEMEALIEQGSVI